MTYRRTDSHCGSVLFNLAKCFDIIKIIRNNTPDFLILIGTPDYNAS